MEDYVRISLETHLFFARIMKEHSLFLQAGFLAMDTPWIQKADFFRNQFEELLRQTVRISNQMVSGCVLQSEELVTPFTLAAEEETSCLGGIPIDSSITRMELALQSGCVRDPNGDTVQRTRRLNERGIRLLEGLIEFKESILREVREGRLFTANYPLLIEHILREARLYRASLIGIMEENFVCFENLLDQEAFWNQIMMEHALFIRGLLDPSEAELIKTADMFAMDFQELLKAARSQDERAGTLCIESTCAGIPCIDITCGGGSCAGTRSDRITTDGILTQRSLEETRRLREFKAAGAKGILECQIQSIILPLLADHVLREANHYIRILECGYKMC